MGEGSRVRAAGWLTSFGVMAASLFGCGGLDTTSGSSSSAVTSVENTKVKSQPIGNCWLYATAGWAESLSKGATNQTLDISESYWTYWYWYEEILGADSAVGALANGKIDTGGYWGTAAELIRRYGWMLETDFVGPAQDENVATKALEAMNASLANGALSTADARRNPRLVRAELDRAWNLAPVTAQALALAFPDGAPDVDGDAASTPASPESFVRAASALPVLSADGQRTVTLADVVGTAAEGVPYWHGVRVGDEAWTEVAYTWSAASSARRTAILKNVQDALNRRLAVPIAWVVSSDVKEGRYPTASARTDEITGFHESILVDYEVQDVPGFGTLKVGVPETRPEALEASLSDDARITFFRIKNSWGVQKTWTEEELRQAGLADTDPSHYGDRANYLPDNPGYNDLELGYLDAFDTDGSHFAKRIALPPVTRFPIPDESSSAN